MVLTFSFPASNNWSWSARSSFARLVVSSDFVLILVLVYESLLIVDLVNRGFGDRNFFPIRFGCLTAAIDSVFGDSRPTVVHGFLPSEVHVIDAPVSQFNLLWRALFNGMIKGQYGYICRGS